MRILFTRFPLESVYGGAEVQTLSLMKGLRERGHDVRFLGSCPVLLREGVRCQVSGVRLDIGPPPVTKWGVISFLWRQHAMRRTLIAQLSARRSPLAALCMLSLSEKLLITEWAVENGMKVFWIEHDRVGRWLRWNPWLPRLRRLSWLATTVVVSDLSKRIYTGLGWDPERIVVIPNGIDLRKLGTRDWPFGPEGLRPSNGELGTGNITKTPMIVPGPRPQAPFLRIGTIARLSPEKGVDLLIEAIKDLPNIHLTIVGAGRDEGKMQKMIQHLHLTQRVTMERALRPDSRSGAEPSGPRAGQATSNVENFYRSLDLFVLPSRDHDPCPLAPMEAMACGVPVIMTDACGTAEYVENGKEALVVPAGSAEALREAIASFSDPIRRQEFSASGRAAALERFSLNRMVGEYEKLLATGLPKVRAKSPPPWGEG